MKVFRAAIVVMACLPGPAMAQGMYPLNPAAVTVNQQRQNQYTVSPNAPTSTYPSNNAFSSPFTSPFVTFGGSYPSRQGGYTDTYTGTYAGSGPR